MTDLLDHIKTQKNSGIDDYNTLKSAQQYLRTKHNNGLKMKGGTHKLTDEEKENVLNVLRAVSNKEQEDYVILNEAASGSGLLNGIDANGNPKYKDYQDVRNKLAELIKGPEEEKNGDDSIAWEGDNNNGTMNMPVVEDDDKKLVITHEVMEKGDDFYHPSQDVKRFSKSLVFVDLRKVLDKSTQRSFSMFFTKNKEYAMRYSGLWSLNKRPVYVHKLRVKRSIPGIKVIDAKVIPDNMDNLELAKNMCGPTEDGTINGIKITQETDNNESVSEYYLCNPEIWFNWIETWMQFGSTEWVKIAGDDTNVQKINVPGADTSTETLAMTEVL